MSLTTQDIPKTIQAVTWLLYFRILATIIVFLLGIYISMSSGELSPFWEGVQKEMFSNFDLNRQHSVVYNVGVLTGALFLPTVIIVLQLLLVKERRSHIMLLILVVLGIVLTLARGHLPIVGLTILILLSMASARNYFVVAKEMREQKRSDILDDF